MATPKRSALGRGLDALISMDNIVTSGTSSIHEIELSQIVPNPDQPRREFDQEALYSGIGYYTAYFVAAGRWWKLSDYCRREAI